MARVPMYLNRKIDQANRTIDGLDRRVKRLTKLVKLITIISIGLFICLVAILVT